MRISLHNILIYTVQLFTCCADNKSIANCQQLMVKTCYQKACCKLFQQVATSLILTDLLQFDEIDKLVCKKLTSCDEPVRLTTCNSHF